MKSGKNVDVIAELDSGSCSGGYVLFPKILRHTLDSGQAELAPGAWKTSVQFFSRRGGGRERDVPPAAEHAVSLSCSHCSTKSGCRRLLSCFGAVSAERSSPQPDAPMFFLAPALPWSLLGAPLVGSAGINVEIAIASLWVSHLVCRDLGL